MDICERYGLSEYKEGVDFVVEQEYYAPHSQYRFFFRKTSGELLGYMSINVVIALNARKTKKETTAYIIDTTSSAAFEKNFSFAMKRFFQEHGYVPGVFLPDFGKTLCTYSVAAIKERFPDCRIMLVNAFPKNENQMWDLIRKVQEATQHLIVDVRGGNELNMATLFLRE